MFSKHLGPKVLTYTVPTRGNLPTNPIMGFASGLVHVSKTVVLVEIRDPEGFAKSLDALVGKANEAIRAEIGGADREAAASLGFLPLKGDRKGYIVSLPPSVFPIPAGMRPTIILGEKYLVIGSTPDVARKALSIEATAGGPAAKELARAMGRVPKDLVLLSVVDTRESLLPEVVANLPGLVGLFSASPAAPAAPAASSRIADDGPPRPPAACVPARGTMLRIDPESIPRPDDLRPFLFPATYAMVVRRRGASLHHPRELPQHQPGRRPARWPPR